MAIPLWCPMSYCSLLWPHHVSCFVPRHSLSQVHLSLQPTPLYHRLLLNFESRIHLFQILRLPSISNICQTPNTTLISPIEDMGRDHSTCPPQHLQTSPARLGSRSLNSIPSFPMCMYIHHPRPQPPLHLLNPGGGWNWWLSQIESCHISRKVTEPGMSQFVIHLPW